MVAVMLVDLEPGDERLERDALPVLVELRTDLTAALLAAVYDEGYPQGLRYLAAYDKDRCVGVAGWRVVATTAGIRKLYVDDLVTARVERGRGVGAALLAELEIRARAAGCQVLDLDSGVQRTDAHRFYLRERFEITGFHFARRVSRARAPERQVVEPLAADPPLSDPPG
jgi:GNAT superfamily N-acetyltransferase